MSIDYLYIIHLLQPDNIINPKYNVIKNLLLTKMDYNGIELYKYFTSKDELYDFLEYTDGKNNLKYIKVKPYFKHLNKIIKILVFN